MPYGSGQGDNYQRKRIPFAFTGLDISTPVNFLDPGRYPYVLNFRQYFDGRLSPRPGLTALSTGYLDLHTIARLNDPTALGGTGDYIYIVGDQTRIRVGKTTLIDRDTGYNGKPFLYITHRPERSPAPLLYLTEGSRMTKWNVNGFPFKWGIFPPLTPPTVKLAAPPGQLSISDFTSTDPQVIAENGNVWNKSVNASTLTQTNRTNTTIAAILYDTGTSGFCNIVPTAMGTDIQPGQRILANSAEYILVDQTFAPIQSTVIESIAYLSGTTGECVIQLAAPSTGLVANTLLYLNSTEYVRVLSVTNGPEGKPCLRCVTIGTFSVGNSVVGVRNFRSYSQTTLAATHTLVTKAYQSLITPAGVGNIRHNIALDLSTVNGRAITDSDELCVGVYIDDITKLIEGRLWIDLDPGTTTTYQASDLSKNYYFYPFRKEDLQAFADKTSTITQLGATFTNIQSSQIDQYNTNLATRTARDPQTGQVVSLDDLLRFRTMVAQGSGGILSGAKRKLLQKYDEQLGLVGQGGGLLTAPVVDSGNYQAQSGSDQWYQLRIKIRDLIRIGTDNSRSLKDTTSFMVNFNVSAAATVRISSAWIGGSFGPDTNTSLDLFGNAYFYRHLARNSVTGEISLASPPTRAGVIPRRQQVTLSVPYYNEVGAPGANQVDKLDIYRYGGTLLQWTYLGTVDNTNPGPMTFTDNFSDEAIANNPVLRFDAFPPFPTADLPQTGTCNVVGTRVTLTSGTFNLNYSPGTEIIINGKTFLFYAQPESTTVVELTESAGSIVGGAYELPNPIIMGSPLPVIFGPFGQGTSGLFYFAVGDNKNPGIVYWTNGNDANSSSDLNYLEITSPSEPLIGGAVYDGRPFVWSSERMFYLNENLAGGVGVSQFTAQEVANSKGAWCRTGITVDTLLYFIGKDGIYESEGGQPRSITDETLYSLFPHDGQPGSGPQVGFTATPDFTRLDSMRLEPDGQYIRFIYQDQFADWKMLIWDKANRRWWYDEYGDGGVRCCAADRGANIYRIMMGTANGAFAVYDANSPLDIADDIPVRIMTNAFDGGDGRAEMRWGDVSLDLSVGSNIATVDAYYNNFTGAIIQTQQFFSLGRSVQVFDIDSGDETFGINIGLDIYCDTNASGKLDLYEWQPAWVPKPERTFLRATDWQTPNQQGAFELQGVLIEADTLGADRIVNIESAEGGLIEALSINHLRQLTKPYSLNTPTIGHSFRLAPTDILDNWRLFNVKWIGNSAPEAVTVYETQYTDHDTPGWKHLRESWITLTSTTAVTLTVTVDGVAYTYTIPSTGGMQTKVYLPFRALKFKLVKYRFSASANFRLYLRDSHVIIGPWGRGESLYAAAQPFGGMSRETGAII